MVAFGFINRIVLDTPFKLFTMKDLKYKNVENYFSYAINIEIMSSSYSQILLLLLKD